MRNLPLVFIFVEVAGERYYVAVTKGRGDKKPPLELLERRIDTCPTLVWSTNPLHYTNAFERVKDLDRNL
jgi:hypothetical protein